MPKPNRRTLFTAVIVTLLVLIAMLLRYYWQYLPSNDLRGLIYIGLFTAWGISVSRHILQAQVRRYLIAMSVLMVFWVAVRSFKYLLPVSTHIGRYCWYSYYFPMLFIPLLLLLIAMSLGKPENFRLPKWANCLLIISAVLLLFVLTNDFHQLAFAFPKGVLFYANSDYTHELIYYISMGWIAFCTISAIAVMIAKCRLPGKRIILLPYVPVALLITYCVLYVTAWEFIKLFAGDLTIVCCLLTTATLDSCIQCGLIQSNSYYTELFECSRIRAVITDEDYNILLSSEDTVPLSKDIMCDAEFSPLMIDNGLRLCGAPVKKGHVVWSEDVSEMNEVLEELADSGEYLATRGSVLYKEVETRKEEQRLIVQNRLYNRLTDDIQDRYTVYSDLISQLEATNDSEQEKRITTKLAVVCTHIKRRGNLLFLAEKGEIINASELRFALAEWMTNIRLCGVKCNLYFNMDSDLTFSQTVRLYDTFQKVLLDTFDTLHSLLVTVSENDGEPYLLLNLSCESDLSQLSYPDVSVSDEGDGEWVISIGIPEGGINV